jgi:hypothetical protein
MRAQAIRRLHAKTLVRRAIRNWAYRPAKLGVSVEQGINDPISGYNFMPGNEAYVLFGKNSQGRRINPAFITRNTLRGMLTRSPRPFRIKNPISHEWIHVRAIPRIHF